MVHKTTVTAATAYIYKKKVKTNQTNQKERNSFDDTLIFLFSDKYFYHFVFSQEVTNYIILKHLMHFAFPERKQVQQAFDFRYLCDRNHPHTGQLSCHICSVVSPMSVFR